MTVRERYINGEYLKNNPTWHLDTAARKAQAILKMMERHQITPRSIGDIGCGVGEILHILQQHLGGDGNFCGYEIAPQAIELAKTRKNEHLQFFLADFRQETHKSYDLLLLIDVAQHLEDSYGYLRDIRSRSTYKIFQLPLNISALSALQNTVAGDNGHVNFYTKDLALKLLQDCGYEVIDHFYTPAEYETSFWSYHPRQLLGKIKRLTLLGLRRLPARLLYLIHKDLAVPRDAQRADSKRAINKWKRLLKIDRRS